jgi:hypothetical protein
MMGPAMNKKRKKRQSKNNIKEKINHTANTSQARAHASHSALIVCVICPLEALVPPFWAPRLEFRCVSNSPNCQSGKGCLGRLGDIVKVQSPTFFDWLHIEGF